MSSLLGSGFPDGWLCATMILAHEETIARRNTSLGCTTDAFKIPSLTISKPVTTFALLSQKQQSAPLLLHRIESGRSQIEIADL